MNFGEWFGKFGGHGWFNYVLALAATAIGVLVITAFKSTLHRRLSGFAARTDNHFDDTLAEMLSRTSRAFSVAVAAIVAVTAIELGPNLERIVRAVALLVCLFQAGVWGSIALLALIEHRVAPPGDAEGDRGRVAVARMAALAARVLLWSFLLLVALDTLGVDITALVAGLGVGGVAVALATQNILGDLFASFSILLDKPFVPGDFVVVGDFMGTVEHIGVKTTRVRSLGGEQIVFANNDLLTSRLRNYKRMDERRVLFRLGLVYQTRAEKLRAIPGMLRAIVERQPQTRFDRAHFSAYGDFALTFEIVYYVTSPDYNVYMDIQQAINLDIYERFEAEHIEFAYPTQTVLVQSGSPGEPKRLPPPGASSKPDTKLGTALTRK
jgi:small-conductance mechanosensitive channel